MRARENKVSVPGKVFVFGEYSVLSGGPAILATHAPMFKLQYSKRNPQEQVTQNPFPEASPAGKLWEKNRALAEEYRWEFFDPYRGAGGFGRSSAEFGALFHALEHMRAKPMSEDALPWLARDRFWEVLGENGTRPSGIDLVAQLARGETRELVYVDLAARKTNRLPSPSSDTTLLFFPSGRKQATHTHLASLQLENSSYLERLRILTEHARELWLGSNFSGKRLGELLNQYAEILDTMGLQARSTAEDLERLRKLRGVLGAKGCGALGVDVYAVAADAAALPQIMQNARDFGLARAFNFQRQEWTQAW